MIQAEDATRMLLIAAGLALFGIGCMQDWALRLVPNRVPAAIAVIGVLLRLNDGTLLGGLLAGTIVFVIATLCWLRGWLGGADVKLFAAGTLLMTPSSAPSFVLASCLAGGILAVAYVALSRIVPKPPSGRPRSRLRRYLRLEQRRLHRRGPLPYATAIAAGAAFILLRGS